MAEGFSSDRKIPSVMFVGGNNDVIVEDDVVTEPPSRLTFTTGIKPHKATRHMSEVYIRSPPNRNNSVPARTATDSNATRRSLSRHGSKVTESRREVKVSEESPYSFMQSGLQTPDTVKRFRQLALGSQTLLEQHDTLTTKWSMPKKTKTFQSSLDRLKRSRVILITGKLGSGKTHLAMDLMLALKDNTLDFHSLIMKSPLDLDLLENTPHPAVVLLDHCFGLGGIGSKYIAEYDLRLKILKRLIDRKRLYLIFTSDSDRFETIDETGLTFLAKLKCCRIDLDSNKYKLTTDEQNDMLSSWSRFFNKETAITEMKTIIGNNMLTDVIGFPAVCQLMGMTENYSQLSQDPSGAIEHFLTEIEQQNPNQYMLLLLVLTTNGNVRPLEPSLQKENFEKIVELTQLKTASFEESLNSIDEMVKCGLLMKHSNGAIEFASRLIRINILRWFVRNHRDESLHVLPIAEINTVTFCDTDTVFEKDDDIQNLKVVLNVHPTLCKSIVTRFSNALDSGDPAVFLQVASSVLWDNINFRDTVFSVYGFHLFFIEDSNKISLLVYLEHTGLRSSVSHALDLISPSKHALNGVAHHLDKLKLEACRCGDHDTLKLVLQLLPDIPQPLLFGAIAIEDTDILEYLIECIAANTPFIVDSSLLQHACKCGSYKAFQFLFSKLDPKTRSTEVRKRDANGLSLLHHAAAGGDVQLFTQLGKLGCDPKAKSRNDFTVLHYGSLFGHLNLVKHICNSNKELLNMKAHHGLTSAHLAAIEGHGDIVTFILECGFDPDTQSEGGNTLSHIAAANGRNDILRLMITTKGDQIHQANNESFTPAHLAAKFDQVESLVYLFKHGVSPRTKTVDGRTFLHLAAFQGQMDTVEFLCSTYPELYKSLDSDGNVVLHDAAAGGNVQVFVKLVECGIDPLQENHDGATVLHDACFYGKLEMVKHICLKYPSMINKQSIGGLSPAVGTTLGGYIDVLEYLVEQGADVKVISCEGSTLLHEAAYAGKIEMVEYLCTKYPYMRDVRNQRSFMPCHFAAQEGHVDVVAYLLPSRTKELPTTEEKQTILHIASYNGMLNIVKYICTKFPVLIQDEDAEGALALHYAGRGGNVEVLDYLIEKGQDPRATTQTASTLLHLSAFDGNLDMVMHLCNEYPDLVGCLDATGHNAAHYAAGSGEVPVLLNILKFGIDPMIRAENGSTLLMKAAYGGRLEMVKYLYTEYPEMVHMQDKFGCNILHYASCGGHVHILMYALEDGDPTTASNDGHSILHVATYHSQEETVSFLCNAFPDLMPLKDSTNKTPSDIAKDLGQENIIAIFETFEKMQGHSKFFPSAPSTGILSDVFCCVKGPNCFGRKFCGGLLALTCCRRKQNV